MNTFSSSEMSDLLSNRFRLETKHSPGYLAECFQGQGCPQCRGAQDVPNHGQSFSPSLRRMRTRDLEERILKANGRAFRDGAGIGGETLNLDFFFDLWKQNFRFEHGDSVRFVFTDELRLAFKLNPRDFWQRQGWRSAAKDKDVRERRSFGKCRP